MENKLTIRKISALICILLAMALWFTPIKAIASELPYIYDESGTLADSELAGLSDRLTTLSQNYGVDVLIYITDNEQLTDAQSAADDFYDYNGFGQGSGKDGMVLYINTVLRQMHISTSGYCQYAFTDAGIDYICDELAEFLHNDSYYQACTAYIALCDDFIAQAITDEPYDSGSFPKGAFPLIRNLLIAIVVGLIAAFVYVSILNAELKSVAPNDSAADYVVPGSMHVTGSREMFLYRTVTKTKKAENNSSKGSSSHISSSGASHGGGGRSF